MDGYTMELIKVGNPNRVVKLAKEKEPHLSYMFNNLTGEIAKVDDKIVSDFETPWYYLMDDGYPVFEGDKYLGSMWVNTFEKAEVD